MRAEGVGVVSLDRCPWMRHAEGVRWASLTDSLGATHLQVDAVSLHNRVELAEGPEQLLVAIDGSVTLDDADRRFAGPGLARVPAGQADTLVDGGATVLIVSGRPDGESNAVVSVVELDAVDYEVPETSDVATAFLTATLGCRSMKVNARRLEPGQVVPYHTEGDQEELFIPVMGPAAMRIADEHVETPVGTVARLAPTVPRSAVNDGDDAALWVMVGAPPTGGATEWDPGAEIVE